MNRVADGLPGGFSQAAPGVRTASPMDRNHNDFRRDSVTARTIIPATQQSKERENATQKSNQKQGAGAMQSGVEAINSSNMTIEEAIEDWNRRVNAQIHPSRRIIPKKPEEMRPIEELDNAETLLPCPAGWETSEIQIPPSKCGRCGYEGIAADIRCARCGHTSPLQTMPKNKIWGGLQAEPTTPSTSQAPASSYLHSS